MASYREQTLIEAPLDSVWGQVGNPNTYPHWAGEVVEVTGLGDVEQGAHFEQKTKTPFGTSTTDFVVEALDDMREICVRCTVSGWYVRWLVTEAGKDTFAELEVGMNPKTIGYTAVDRTVGKRWYRKTVDEMLGRLRERLQ